MIERMNSPFKSYEINCDWFSVPQDNSDILRQNDCGYYEPYINFDNQAKQFNWKANIIVYNDNSFIGICTQEIPSTKLSDVVWGAFNPEIGISINKWFPGIKARGIEISGPPMSALRLNCFRRLKSEENEYLGRMVLDSHLGPTFRFGPAKITSREVKLSNLQIAQINQIYYNEMLNDITWNPKYEKIPIYYAYGLFPTYQFAMSLDPSLTSKKITDEALMHGYKIMNLPIEEAKKLHDETTASLSPLRKRHYKFEDQLKALEQIETFFPRKTNELQ